LPRLYVDTATFIGMPEALTFPQQIAQLQAVSGGLDRLLARASRRVDGFARKRVIAPPSTTIATGGGISAGATSISVTSTLGFDNGQEEAVIIGTGGTQEIVPVLPGGIQVTTWLAPYPGVIQLAQGTTNAHSAGETVQGCYQEVSTVGSSSSLDTYSESLLALNQAAQLAQAHAPQFDTHGLTRIIFLKCYPITNLLKLEHMLPIDQAYNQLQLTNVGIQPAAGYLRLPIGSFVLPEGLFRTTYTAGFSNVSEEVAQATALYAADQLQKMISRGAHDTQQGKVKMRFGQPTQPKSLYVQDAEDILTKANLKRYT
jgi:hypothetical protein